MQKEIALPKNWFSANLVTALGLFLVFTAAAIAANALTLNKYVCVALGLGIGVMVGLKISKWYVLGGFVGLFFTLMAGSNILFTNRESSSGLIVILFEFFGSVIFFFWKMKAFLDSVKRMIEKSEPKR